MKKIIICLLVLLTFVVTGCKENENIIKVCASELPHADILENCVKDLLKEKGYTLEVVVLDWTIQNDAVALKDYDANYFQHTDYLGTYNGKTKLIPTCKVHYEPLGIYYGKEEKDLKDGKTFEICNDESNAIRALNLLFDKKIIKTLPVENNKLTFTGSTYTEGDITVTLISEELLVSSLADFDFGLLPCNTAFTGNVDKTKLVSKEDKEELVAHNANILACREDDYKSNATYKAKIDALTDILLSKEVSDYVIKKYANVITCDSSSQIDLR